MAVRARPDNLGLDHPAETGATAFAFEELWEHRDDLRAVSRRIVTDDAAADDVVQETFLRALANAKRLDRRISFAPWLATVARRRSIDRLRAEGRARLVATVPEQAGGAGDDPLEHVLQQEKVTRVRAALATLGTRERQLLLRQLAHGLTLAELAAEEATSVASVRSVLSRARTKLRIALERGGPLGAAPMPGMVAALKRRFHRWAARFEGSTPMLVGAGAQFGDAVVAVVAAAALLLAGNVPAPERAGGTTIEMASSGRPSTHGGPPNGPASNPGRGHRGENESAGHGPDARHDAATPVANRLLMPPPVDLPGRPADGADQPEDAFFQQIAVSEDGRTLVVAGLKNTANGDSAGGDGLYRSDDGGHTWRWLEAGGFVFGGSPLLRNDAIFVASDPALLRSNNGGKSFWPVGSARGGVAAVADDPADTRIFLAPAGFVAYDAATNETTPYRAAPASPTLGGLAVRVTSSGPEFLVGLEMYTSTTRLQGYVQHCSTLACAAPVALPGLSRAPKVLVSRSVAGLTFAWYGGQLLRSVDGGATFSSVTMPAGAIHTVLEGDDGEFLLARSNPGGSGASGLLRSVDNGVTWSPLGVGTALEQGAEGLAYVSGGRIIAGLNASPGFRCSIDGGVTWTPRCPAL